MHSLLASRATLLSPRHTAIGSSCRRSDDKLEPLAHGQRLREATQAILQSGSGDRTSPMNAWRLDGGSRVVPVGPSLLCRRQIERQADGRVHTGGACTSHVRVPDSAANARQAVGGRRSCSRTKPRQRRVNARESATATCMEPWARVAVDWTWRPEDAWPLVNGHVRALRATALRVATAVLRRQEPINVAGASESFFRMEIVQARIGLQLRQPCRGGPSTA